MKPKQIYALIALILFLTTPWPFVTEWRTTFLGFPPWALYCLVMTGFFAVVVALLLRFGWDACAEQEDNE